jgi:hypothetical protein
MNAVDSDQLIFDATSPSYGALVLLCLKGRKFESLDPRPRHVGLRRGFIPTKGISLNAESK